MSKKPENDRYPNACLESRDFLRYLRDQAEAIARNITPGSWRRAYEAMAQAADILDAMTARWRATPCKEREDA